MRYPDPRKNTTQVSLACEHAVKACAEGLRAVEFLGDRQEAMGTSEKHPYLEALAIARDALDALRRFH